MTVVTELDLPEFDPADPGLSGWRWHVEANALLDSGHWLAQGPLSLVVLDREAGEFFLRSRAAEFPGKLIADLFGVTDGPLRDEIDNNIINTDGDVHRRLRSLVNPDAADFHNPANMLDALAGYCRTHGQPVPETVGQVVRCCLESLALRYRAVLDSIETLTGHTMKTIRVVGGGSQNTLLNQMTADACDRVVVTGPVEATALGNVMVQAIATGHLANLAEGRAAVAASTPQETYQPVDRTGWDDAYGRFLTLLG